MKILLVFCFVTCLSCSLFGQSPGFLVVDGDTTELELRLKRAKGINSVFFRRGYEENLNEVTADNAEVAWVSGQWKAVSFTLPSSGEKVWGQCFFDGVEQLVKYNSVYYILDSLEVKELEKFAYSQGGTRKFIGQMITFFHSRVDFDFTGLSYEAKSLTQPFILWHEKNGWNYTDYNKYVNRRAQTFATGELGFANGSFNLNSIADFETEGQLVAIGINRIINYPDLSGKISLFFGGDVEGYFFNQYLKNELSGGRQFVNFQNKLFSVGGKVGLDFKLVSSPALQVSLRPGIKVSRFFGGDKQVRFEAEYNKVVYTEFVDVGVDESFSIYQINQVIVDIPGFSDSFEFGVGVNFPLKKSSSDVNTFHIDRSYRFSIYYNL